MDERFIQERIARLRLQKGVSARDMSLSLGQSESYINTIENKKSLPSMTVFLYICDYFNISPADFFDEGNNHPETMSRLTDNLKKLDGELLEHLAALAKALTKD